MKTWTKSLILAAVALAVTVMLIVKSRGVVDAAGPQSAGVGVAESSRPMPKLVSLGAGQCIPCRMMEPIRAELRQECEGRMTVEFHDVWKDPAAGRAFGVRVIPTLIFYDATGRELSRHEGFISKEEIRAKWRSLGIDLGCDRRS